jgi:hypothetical protein
MPDQCWASRQHGVFFAFINRSRDMPYLESLSQLDYETIALCLSAVALIVFAIKRMLALSSNVPGARQCVERPEIMTLRRRAAQLHIPNDAIDRFVEKYKRDGLSEEMAIRKIIDDTIKDRARYGA